MEQISDRERALAALLENLAGMAYRCRNDASWTMELVSPGAFALTGYEAEALIENRGVSFGSLIHPDDAEPLNAKCQANLAARRPCSNEYRIRTKSGDERWVLDVASGIYGPSGELLAIDGFVIDVTARRRLEEQLSHSQKLEGIGRFAGGIAHDFNNLLGAMLSYAELVRESVPPDSVAARDIAEVCDAAKRAADLTTQLLAFARKQPIRPQILILNEVVARLQSLLARVVGADVELAAVLGAGLWAVEADAGQLEQVLLNLAVNARDAMPDGGTMTVATSNVVLVDADRERHADAAPGDYVKVALSDTGGGIPEALRQRIFEPFFSTKGSKGTGLGLAICHEVVSQAHGHILVHSAEGRGTTFEIYLPRSHQPLEALSPQPGAEPMRAGRGETVLVVDDHRQMREVVARTLGDAGYRVVTAENGEQALARAPGRVDLVITDLVMPRMDGQELAARLGAERPGLRVLFVSGYADTTVPRKNGALAGFDLLAKPFTPDHLRRKVREILDRPA